MSTYTHIDVSPDGNSKTSHWADCRSPDVRAVVPVFPSAFLTAPGLLGPGRRNRPIGKGRSVLVKSAAELEAGLKNLARSIGGAILIAAIGLSWPSGANAYLITQIGTSGGNPGGLPEFEVSGLLLGDVFNLTYDGLVAGLGTDATVSITSLTSTAADISVTINNTSTPISGDDPRITSFGISVENIDMTTPLSDTNTGGTFLTLADDSNFPGFSLVEVCGTSGNTCAGGGSGGIPFGMSDAIVLSLNGSFGVIPLLTLDSFAIKIQGGPDIGGNDSYELPGTPSAVPVPAALPLFLSALAGLGFVGWRRNRAAV